MKNIVVILVLFSCFQTFAQKDKIISGKIIKYANQEIYLGHYDGEEVVIDDTTTLDKKGKFTFKKSNQLQGGLYTILLQEGEDYYFTDFLKDDKLDYFKLKIDLELPVYFTKIKKSNSNKIYYAYLKEISPLDYQLEQLDEQQEGIINVTDSLNRINPRRYSYDGKQFIKLKKTSPKPDQNVQKIKAQRLMELTKEAITIRTKKGEVIDKRIAISTKHQRANPGTFTAKYLRWQEDMDIPKDIRKGNQNTQYQYCKVHFFDKLDFSDARMTYSGFYKEKLYQYLDEWNYQITDSLKNAIDFVLQKAQKDSIVFKYTCEAFREKLEQQGQDKYSKVLMHLLTKWYINKRAWWIDQREYDSIKHLIKSNTDHQIGHPCPTLIMPDTTGKLYDLKDTKGSYTLIIFWSATCGHCKRTMPELARIYNEYKTKGFKVYSVCIDYSLKPLEQYLKDHPLPWVNLIGKDNKTYRSSFSITRTPTTYLLDQNHIVLRKKVSMIQLEDFLDTQLSE